jgi:acetyl esterase
MQKLTPRSMGRRVTLPEVPGRRRTLMAPTTYGDATCFVYDPPVARHAAPAVHVNFHGGGFVAGHPDGDDPLCRYVAAKAQIVVVNVDYVLAPQHPFPAAVRQAYEVVCWAAKHGREHGWNGDSLSVGGQSAGANLAAAVARQALQAGTPKLRLQVLHYPPLDLVTSGHDKVARRTAAPGRVITPWMVELFNQAYIPNRAERAHPLASPVYAQNADGLNGIAPALVITAQRDLLRDEGVAYAAKLRAAGALREYREVAGADHGYDIVGHDIALVRATYDSIAQHLGTGAR